MTKIMNTVTKKDLGIIDAKGSYLINRNGDKILDWFADVGTVNVGYKPIELMREIYNSPQHIPNTLVYDEKEKIAELLCNMTKMDKLFFSNSGAEANEAAIKIVRKTMNNRGVDNERNIIYTVKGGFHGRTYGAVSAGDGAKYHYDGFGPHLDGFKHFEKIEDIKFQEASAVMLATMNGNNVAQVYSKDFIVSLRDMTEKHGIAFVLDEVQVGSGRTGIWNAFDNYGVIPDVLCLGKGIACGIPTGVTLARGDFAEAFTPGTHYSTFGGSPLSIAGIEHLIHTWNYHNLSYNVTELGERLKREFECMEHITGVDGIGLWIGVNIENNKAMELSEELLKNNMFVPTFRKESIKFTPMLNSTEYELEKGIEIIKKSLSAVFK